MSVYILHCYSVYMREQYNYFNIINRGMPDYHFLWKYAELMPKVVVFLVFRLEFAKIASTEWI